MCAPNRRPDPAATAALAADEVGLFQGIVEHLGGVVLVCDVEGRVHWANARAAEWLGAIGPIDGAAAAERAAHDGVVRAARDGELRALHDGDAAEAKTLAPLPRLGTLALPWRIDAAELAHAGAGETLRLRPDALRGADGVVRRCHARLGPLPRSAGPPLVLIWIDEQVEDDGASLTDTQRRRALASAQVGSWSRNFADGGACVDPLWCYSLGLDPCEGPDHLERWARRIHPDDVDRFRRASAELAVAPQDAPDFDVEYRILTADSRWLWVLQRGRVSRRGPRDGAPLEAAGICIDIDARKRAEVEVHENESRLATALWGAQAAFWQFHIPSDTATRSPLWYAMTGYSREQWDGSPQPWTSRLHPEDRPGIERLIAEHLEGRSQSLELRYRMRCADGSWKWMMDRGRVVEWDFDGRPISAIGVSIDIDRQKRAELELLSSERRLETAIWGAGVGLYELDCVSGATRWLNDWCERFDIDPCAGSEHVERWDANIHPEDLPAARARFSGHLAGCEEYYDAEYRIRTRAGAWRWIFERGRVTERDAAGVPLRLVGTCMDIDARRRVELAAEDSRRRLELALESAQGCLWEWDLARARYNDAYYELLGVDPAAGRLQPTFWSDRAHPDDRERVLAAEREVVEGRMESYNTQYRVRHADGSWRWMVDRFRASARGEDGRATGLMGFAIDVTEDVQVREALGLLVGQELPDSVPPSQHQVVRAQLTLRAQAQILETMSEAVLLVDDDDVAKLANPAFEALACRRREELLGRPLTDLLRECVAEYSEITAAAIAHWSHDRPHGPFRREFDWRRPDGVLHRVLGVFTRLDIDGTPHVLCVYSDLTEQRAVERRILDVVQQTQRRIGADLHDGLGQELAGIAMLLRGLQCDAADGRTVSAAQVAEVVAHVSRSIETARTMARGLAPVDPEHGGLEGALQRLVDAAARQSGVCVVLQYRLPSSVSFTAEESTHLLRIAQEAVSNALRHAEPRTVLVALTCDCGFATLTVSDDGRGFPDADEPQRGLGLKTMRFRASMLRGDLQILQHSASALRGSGITLICRVPVHSRRLAGPTASQDSSRP